MITLVISDQWFSLSLDVVINRNYHIFLPIPVFLLSNPFSFCSVKQSPSYVNAFSCHFHVLSKIKKLKNEETESTHLPPKLRFFNTEFTCVLRIGKINFNYFFILINNFKLFFGFDVFLQIPYLSFLYVDACDNWIFC